MIRRPPRSTRTDTPFPTRRSSDLARAERQAAIGKANVEQRERSLKLVQTRIRSKLSSDLDARADETVLAQARQALVRAEGQPVLLVHALAMLAGPIRKVVW